MSIRKNDEEKIDFSLFLNEYLNDARQGFQRANTALLALEKDYAKIERLDEASRAVHTLKSSSAMLGFTEISDLAHFSEDLLTKIKTNEIPVARDAIDLVFEIIDALEQMVKERGEKKISDFGIRISELKKKIKAIGAKNPPPSPLFQRGARGDLKRKEWGDSLQLKRLTPSVSRLDCLTHFLIGSAN